MPLSEWVAFAAAGAFVICGLIIVGRAGGKPAKSDWMFPALFGLAFFGWSVFAIINEGPTGFWPEHVRNLWGNQIWFDLLLAVTAAWVVMAPRAKGLGMNVYLWFLLSASLGSIGLMAALSRFLFLKARDEEA